MATLTISEILRGCTPGRIQSVGYMQVIPLTATKDMTDDRIVSPAKMSSMRTTDYGSMSIKNESDKIMIVPSQAAYVVKQAAQDHALPHVGIIGKKKSKSFDTARCIQENQGGYISSGNHKMAILPFMLREPAHKERSERDYSKLWSAIRRLNNETKAGNIGNLVHFLDKFKDELDQFIAEFEPVPNQVGAIILINGKVVGVERAPNYEYWTEIWPALIRECYGSLALIEAKNNNGEIPVPKTRSVLGEVSSLADLAKAVKDAESRELENVRSVFGGVSETEMKRDGKDSGSSGLTIESLSHKRFVGQIVREDEKIIYGSLIATSKWRTNEDWYMAKSFSL